MMFWLVIFIGFASNIVAQQNCRTANGTQGICTALENCVAVADLLRKTPRPIPTDVANYVKTSSRPCGMARPPNIKICCTEDQITTTSEVPVVIQTKFSEGNVDVSNHRNLRLLPLDSCGQAEVNRVSNGVDATLFELPWMALLLYDTTDGLKPQCGGSLINNRYVLTAAHCHTMELTSVRLGELNLETDPDFKIFQNRRYYAQKAEEVSVDRVIKHPNYNGRPINDIALLRLSREVDLDEDHIRPICLPYNEEIQKSVQITNLTVAGWGFTENSNRQPSNILQKGSVPLLHNDRCIEAFPKDLQTNENFICAGAQDGVDSCSGDSGGPLFNSIITKGESRAVQYGVVAAGKLSCGANINTPGVYTKVGNYMEWILNEIEP